jgi:N-acetylmuramic acid 6-phosphate etherase
MAPGSPLLSMTNAPILLETGKETLRGWTRLTACTAQNVALGMLSSLMVFELGPVYQGLLVNFKVAPRDDRVGNHGRGPEQGSAA